MNQIINMYEIIDSILQDVETSILFSKLQIMHSSIIKTTDLYKELINIQNNIKDGRLPIEVTLDNVLSFRDIIKIDSYIHNNKITYILHIPIVYSLIFDYYHFYQRASLRHFCLKINI